jgi:hypothetical protein
MMTWHGAKDEGKRMFKRGEDSYCGAKKFQGMRI